MTASLVEMVMAIVLTGLIFASAIIPTVQTLVAYQDAELDLQKGTVQTTAAVRAEQVAADIWRDADPPDSGAPLQVAGAGRLEVGDWELREEKGRVEQRWRAGVWTPIAEPVLSFSFQYLLNDGTWVTTVPKAKLDAVLAVRFGWSDPDSGMPSSGLIVAPDRAFSAGLLELSMPDTSAKYRRKDYEREITLSLGSWE